MGLDSVEIVMKVEKTFGINIPDQEAEKIITVGDFHNSVWRHLEGKYSDKCKSQTLFYRLRQSFVDTFKFSKQDIRLNTPVNDIFPKDNRREHYINFENNNRLQLPALVLTKPWANFLFSFGIVTIAGGLGLSIILITIFDFSKWTLLFPVLGILLTYSISEILNPKRTEIEPESIRDFIENLLSNNYATLTKDAGTNRKEVESVINYIIADLSGLELPEITPEKRIHDDLGID